MSEAVVVALITGVVSLIGAILTANSTQKLTSYKLEELQRDTNNRIDGLKDDFGELKTKVEKHNNLVERMAIVEQSAKSAHKRLDEMKGCVRNDA